MIHNTAWLLYSPTAMLRCYVSAFHHDQEYVYLIPEKSCPKSQGSKVPNTQKRTPQSIQSQYLRSQLSVSSHADHNPLLLVLHKVGLLLLTHRTSASVSA
jgi:hypothetical protein